MIADAPDPVAVLAGYFLTSDIQVQPFSRDAHVMHLIPTSARLGGFLACTGKIGGSVRIRAYYRPGTHATARNHNSRRFEKPGHKGDFWGTLG